jgi:hypothetical protein
MFFCDAAWNYLFLVAIWLNGNETSGCLNIYKLCVIPSLAFWKISFSHLKWFSATYTVCKYIEFRGSEDHWIALLSVWEVGNNYYHSRKKQGNVNLKNAVWDELFKDMPDKGSISNPAYCHRHVEAMLLCLAGHAWPVLKAPIAYLSIRVTIPTAMYSTVSSPLSIFDFLTS